MDRSFAREVTGVYGRIPLPVGGLAIGAIVLAVWWWLHSPLSRCEQAFRSGDRDAAVAICQASYPRTGDAGDLLRAATAALYQGNYDDAKRLAELVLAGTVGASLRGDAHQLLSHIALLGGADAEATLHAVQALVAHATAGSLRGQSADLVLISHVAFHAGEFMPALDAADRALSILEHWPDPHVESRAAVARADALRRIGDLRGAVATLGSAAARTREPCDLVWIQLKTALSHMEAAEDAEAVLALEDASHAQARCPVAGVPESILMNQAWLMRWTSRDAAVLTLDELAERRELVWLDEVLRGQASWSEPSEEEPEALVLRGYLAADRGRLSEAAGYLDRAASGKPSDADWPWEIERARGELAELRGGLVGDVRAEMFYRRSAAMVAALRGSSRARSAFLVASHRAPYDDLIALLARQGRWRDVLEVVLELDASDMLRATTELLNVPDRRPSPDPAEPTLANRSSTVDDLLAAWRDRDLVIVIAPSRRRIAPGHERVYRVHLTGGQVTGADLGEAAAARDWAQQLVAEPGDVEAARGLGRMFVPEDAADRELDVLAIGPLGKVPIAALRTDDASLVVARRPLARVLTLQATGPESAGTGAPIVIADSLGDLPSAALEGAMVAEVIGPAAHLSGAAMPTPATRARLWDARDAAVLHVAGHVKARGRWRALHLSDGDVDPTEMVQRGLAPRLAVLAGCGSAAATDEEGWGSIAAALLESGTSVVIGTDRSIDDGQSLPIMRAFYAQPDWRTDPSRALARVQRAIDAAAAAVGDPLVSARSWAAFFVLRRAPATSRRP